MGKSILEKEAKYVQKSVSSNISIEVINTSY